MSFQDFQKAPNRLTSRDVGLLALVVVIVILVVSALGAANYYLAGLLPDGGEFTLLRTGGRFFLFDRIEPYTANIPASVQEQVYGRAALPGEDAYILDIPFHLLIAFFPLALFPDELMARAFWMALTEIALFGLIFFSIRLLGRQISRIFMILIFSACFVSLYAYLSFLEGSPTILLGLAYAGILLSLRADLDEWTGALLVLSSFQWEIGAPFLLFIVLWVVWERRWRVFIGAAMLSFILYAITLFIYPGWVMPFWRAAWNSFRTEFGFSVHEILGALWPDYGSALGWVLTAALVVALGYEWRAARDANSPRFVWAAFLTLAVTPLLGQRVQMDQLVLLSMPLMLIVAVSRERWRKLGLAIALMLLLFYFGIPWLLYTQGAPQGIGLTGEELLFLFWPVFAVIGLYWMRWWIIRPPRTWIDNFTQREQ